MESTLNPKPYMKLVFNKTFQNNLLMSSQHICTVPATPKIVVIVLGTTHKSKTN